MSTLGQQPGTIIKITVTAGVAQRVLTDSNDKRRFVRSAYFVPKRDNTGLVYVGPSTVSASLYSDALKGTDGDQLSWKGDWVMLDPANRVNYLDLYNTWVDGDDDGDVLFVTVSEL